MTPKAAILRSLFQVPPGEFVATRNAMVKDLRKAGDREAAAALATLRRPSIQDWALNMVAADDAEATRAFLDAGARLREAQAAAVEGRGGGDVRSALQELRAATSRMSSRAGKVLAGQGRSGAGETGPLVARLTEIAGSDEAADQLRGGHLGSAEIGETDPFSGLTPGPGRTGSAPGPSSRAKSKSKRQPQPEADREAERAAARAAELEELRGALEESEAELATASAQAEDAERQVERAREALDNAKGRLRSATAAVKKARSRLSSRAAT